MATTEIDVRTNLPVPPARVFAALADRASWPEWSGHDRAEPVEVGDTAGLGAVWVMHRGRTQAKERVTDLTPDARVAYTLLSGLPLSDYRAGFDLTATDDGTAVHWHSEFRARPGTGWIYRVALRRFMHQGLDRLATRLATR